MTTTPYPLLAARDLHKAYRRHSIEVPILNGLDLDVVRATSSRSSAGPAPARVR